MFDAIRSRSDRDSEEGFTLIELMVVVLIIGILLAIAIPTFLGARDRANDRSAQSNLRNALTAEKTLYTDGQVYTATERRRDHRPVGGRAVPHLGGALRAPYANRNVAGHLGDAVLGRRPGRPVGDRHLLCTWPTSPLRAPPRARSTPRRSATCAVPACPTAAVTQLAPAAPTAPGRLAF